jgi:hypothetical protein
VRFGPGDSTSLCHRQLPLRRSAGIVLGVALLGDRLSATGTGLATEVISLLALVAGAVLITRAPSFG